VKNRLRNAVVMLAMSLATSSALAAPTVQDIEFSTLPGSKFAVRVEFNETPPDFKTYAIEKPARIAIDFPGTTSSLDQKRFSLPYGNATNAVVLESGDRTRLVVELVSLCPMKLAWKATACS
jgi:type IV pilus assembly protein PilQ